ncbi:MAG: C45 family autoproteolytic acyltransferase/hydrolase [Ardenticatenaceae bacterium]
MRKIRLLEIEGSPYEMGYQHGVAHRDAIRMFAEERVHLSGSPVWTGRGLSREQVIALGDACVEAHYAYSPQLMRELEGMAEATDLSLSELVIVNGFTDFIDVVYNVGHSHAPQAVPRSADNCTAFIVPDHATAEGYGFFGQTWDMHDTATPYVILLRCRPNDGPASLVFTITGCVGMIGMNDAGIAVGINNLLGGDGQIGVTWPFVIRKVLLQTNIDDALACITDAQLAGAHNYLLFDKEGRGYNIEAMSTEKHIQELDDNPITHTNHCLNPITDAVARERAPASLAHSQTRLLCANQLLTQRPITPQSLMALTREPTAICTISKPPFHVETCGAAIMRPATGDFWAVWGLPTENEYERFSV